MVFFIDVRKGSFRSRRAFLSPLIAVGWQSGLMRRSRKPVGEKSPREFKSHPHRRNMEFILQNQLFILLGLILAAFGFLFWKLSELEKKIQRLYGGEESGDFKKDIVKRVTRTETKIEELVPHIELSEAVSRIAIQKIGFLRFNPFRDTGGDNSFAVALLDFQNNGIIISSLYSRDGTRLYSKKIEKGKTKHPLSEEEKRVLDEAVNKAAAN